MIFQNSQSFEKSECGYEACEACDEDMSRLSLSQDTQDSHNSQTQQLKLVKLEELHHYYHHVYDYARVTKNGSEDSEAGMHVHSAVVESTPRACACASSSSYLVPFDQIGKALSTNDSSKELMMCSDKTYENVDVYRNINNISNCSNSFAMPVPPLKTIKQPPLTKLTALIEYSGVIADSYGSLNDSLELKRRAYYHSLRQLQGSQTSQLHVPLNVSDFSLIEV